MSSSCSFSNFPLNHSWASIRLRDICDTPQHLTHQHQQHWNIIIIIIMKSCIFSNFPLSLHRVMKYLWHTQHLTHQHQQHWNIIIFMKFCIFSNFPQSLHQVTRCLWHTSQHLHTNISNTFKHHHHFMNWKTSKISALARSPTGIKMWELLQWYDEC